MHNAKRYLPVFLMLLSAIQPGFANAQKKAPLPYAPTANEFKMLPAYCYARMKGDPATKESWKQQMGSEIFLHLHHYCSGMNFLNRARFEMDKQRQKEYLQQASSEFNYVIRNWPPAHNLTVQAKKLKMQADMMIRK